MRKGKKWKLRKKRYVRVTITLRPEQVKKLKKVMRKKQVYMSEIIREAVEVYLEHLGAMEEWMEGEVLEEEGIQGGDEEAYKFFKELAKEIKHYKERGYSWYAIAKMIEREHGISLKPEEIKEILKSFWEG